MTIQTPRSATEIPGPLPNRLLGWRADLIEFALDSVGFLTRLHRQHGRIVRVGQGKMSATFTFHPDLTRQILSAPSLFYSFDLDTIPFPFSDIEALHSLTTALALMNGEQHRIQRRLMAPAFHASRLQIYVQEIIDITETFFAAWKPGAVVDLYEQMDLFTVWLAMKLFVGMDPTIEGRHFADLFAPQGLTDVVPASTDSENTNYHPQPGKRTQDQADHQLNSA